MKNWRHYLVVTIFNEILFGRCCLLWQNKFQVTLNIEIIWKGQGFILRLVDFPVNYKIDTTSRSIKNINVWRRHKSLKGNCPSLFVFVVRSYILLAESVKTESLFWVDRLGPARDQNKYSKRNYINIFENFMTVN